MKPVALIPWAPGTNCHEETARAFELAGARSVIRPLKKGGLAECDLLGLSGGFSWGDHFGSGRVVAFDLANWLRDELLGVIERKTPIIGICNGFQILVNLGLLPGGRRLGEPTAALDFNQQFRFEHWHKVQLCLHEPTGTDCVWTRGLDGRQIYLPVAHGEGRLITRQEVKIIATYGTATGDASYPTSPNGSAIAGICDESGLVMGMMPHPERRVDELHGGSDGLCIFQAGVQAVFG
jgi:phosphoribosylformylglycinamidine synthase